MNKKHTRNDAAQMLGISPSATPAEVDAAYMRRLQQFLDFDNGERNLRFNKDVKLYNARVIMSRPENKQWISRLELALTSETVKTFETIIATLQVMKNITDGPVYHALLDELSRLIQKLHKQYRVLKGSITYILGMLVAKMIYDRIYSISEQDMWVNLGVYGSMMIAAFAMGFAMDAMDKKKKQIDNILNVMKFSRDL